MPVRVAVFQFPHLVEFLRASIVQNPRESGKVAFLTGRATPPGAPARWVADLVVLEGDFSATTCGDAVLFDANNSCRINGLNVVTADLIAAGKLRYRTC